MASTLSWPHPAPEPRTARIVNSARRQCRRAFKGIMRSYRLKIPKYDMPLRIRPWFILITALIMLILALLGFTNLAHALPINDKLLHFFCLGIATGVFYFIFDVEEESRRIWFWRHSPLMLTALICFFVGGVMSEFIQSMLPYKEFQFGDIVANLLGSSIGLYTAYYLERYYRQRREISRLYRPLSASLSSIHLPDDMEEENDLDSGTQLLPLHLPGHSPKPETPTSSIGLPAQGKGKTKGKGRVRSDSLAMADVWDEREELFGVGDDDSDGSDDEGQGGDRVTKEVRTPRIVHWAEGSGDREREEEGQTPGGGYGIRL